MHRATVSKCGQITNVPDEGLCIEVTAFGFVIRRRILAVIIESIPFVCQPRICREAEAICQVLASFVQDSSGHVFATWAGGVALECTLQA